MKEFRIIRPALQDEPYEWPPFWLVMVLYVGIILIGFLFCAILRMLPL
jgi:hypothetical protein